MNRLLWQPSEARKAASNLSRFLQKIEHDWDVRLDDYDALWRWSVAENEKFWLSLRDVSGVVASQWGDTVLIDGDKMPGARYFPDARLNFAENLLQIRNDDTALVFWAEDKIKRRLSRRQLYDQVSQMVIVLRNHGVGPGDRVGAVLPNMPEAIIAMLATTALGAIWSSCSPDFGTQGILDRFGQIAPKILFTVDHYVYNGKSHDIRDKMAQVVRQLSTLERVFVAPYDSDEPAHTALDVNTIDKALSWHQALSDIAPGDISFTETPFNHPIYILYSSGTTGAPKCIVHSAGGTLLTHAKEHQLQCDIQDGDRVFYFTTCGWMMWNWLVTALLRPVTLLLYDGSPFAPSPHILFDYAETERATFFGTSAKFIDALRKAEISPRSRHDLSSIRSLSSTGSPLVPEGFDYVYQHIKPDLHLMSMSGGTDLMACFVAGNPLGPVYSGEIQARALAMAVDVFDDAGHSLRGDKGELVCTRPFPSMPVGFWNDPGDAKYHAAYYEKFHNVWCHGDWVELTETGGMVIYGRSDATLNPGGVRIGTAEIYRQVEQLDEVVESLVIGQEWEGDTRVVLFVVLRSGLTLDAALRDRIKRQVRENCSPRHVPAKILQVTDIPRTKSNKIVELAVREVVHGRPVKNREALANPEALAQFADRPELASIDSI